jgi:hypothetical protein
MTIRASRTIHDGNDDMLMMEMVTNCANDVEIILMAMMGDVKLIKLVILRSMTVMMIDGIGKNDDVNFEEESNRGENHANDCS